MNSPANQNIDTPGDRRNSGRVPFASVHGVLEYQGTLPDQEDFRPVKGRDLSQTGFAFSTARWPASDSIVVMLGDRTQPSFATARIVGCQGKTAAYDEKEFEVRCEFERWLVQQA